MSVGERWQNESTDFKTAAQGTSVSLSGKYTWPMRGHAGMIHVSSQ